MCTRLILTHTSYIQHVVPKDMDLRRTLRRNHHYVVCCQPLLAKVTLFFFFFFCCVFLFTFLMSWENYRFHGAEHCPYSSFPPSSLSISLSWPEFPDCIKQTKPPFLFGCMTTIYALGTILQAEQTFNTSKKLFYLGIPDQKAVPHLIWPHCKMCCSEKVLSPLLFVSEQ